MTTARRLHVMRLLLLALLLGLLRVGWGPMLAAQADPFFAAVCHAGGPAQPGTEQHPNAGHCPACLVPSWAPTPFVDPRWQAVNTAAAAEPQPPIVAAPVPARRTAAHARAPPLA